MLAAPLTPSLFVSTALDPNQFSRTNLCHTFRVRGVSVGICRVVPGPGSYGGNYRWNGATFRARIERSAWPAYFGWSAVGKKRRGGHHCAAGGRAHDALDTRCVEGGSI